MKMMCIGFVGVNVIFWVCIRDIIVVYVMLWFDFFD